MCIVYFVLKMSLFSYHSNFYELLSITPPLNMKEVVFHLRPFIFNINICSLCKFNSSQYWILIVVFQLNYNHLKLDNFSSFSSDLGMFFTCTLLLISLLLRIFLKCLCYILLGPEDRRRRSLVLEGKESTKFNTTQFQGSSHTRAHCM